MWGQKEIIEISHKHSNTSGHVCRCVGMVEGRHEVSQKARNRGKDLSNSSSGRSQQTECESRGSQAVSSYSSFPLKLRDVSIFMKDSLGGGELQNYIYID